MSSKMEQLEVLRVELEVLKREHRDLDEAIDALHAARIGGYADAQTAEKAKTGAEGPDRPLEDRIMPDIIA